jgi:hypothetical protein
MTNVHSATTFTYLDIKLVVFQLWVKQHDYWRFQWASEEAFVSEKVQKVLHDNHSLLINFGG